MSYPPSEDPTSQASINQSLEITNSTLANSPIGQAEGNVNQANRDINYFFNTSQEDWSAEKIEKIRRFEESLREEFREKLKHAALLVDDLRRCIEHQLTEGKTKDFDTVLSLLDELQAITGNESTIKAIKEDLDFCYEGGVWLQDNKRRLSLLAKDYIFTQGDLPMLLKGKHQRIPFKELENRFVQDLETYIGWIVIYLKIGRTPQSKDFNDGIFKLHFDFPESAYKEAFRILTLNYFEPEVSGLSPGAAIHTASYVNRFIFDRDLKKDANTSVLNKVSEAISACNPLSKNLFFILLAVSLVVLVNFLR
ncbi:hypothetical protein H6F75_25985 [Nodosilinea sp. FACHB-131]|uniref:hypothetical protein n=1 Tax=Cyanophyceae TaxID=3028117 RepID=UPI0016883801|nr:hypothetical protein [Nodosilinea sp. FACHB-131]MBD1876940.1 hypothetical protein [Nodosilinea sp. FACHB-131]